MVKIYPTVAVPYDKRIFVVNRRTRLYCYKTSDLPK